MSVYLVSLEIKALHNRRRFEDFILEDPLRFLRYLRQFPEDSNVVFDIHGVIALSSCRRLSCRHRLAVLLAVLSVFNTWLLPPAIFLGPRHISYLHKAFVTETLELCKLQ